MSWARYSGNEGAKCLDFSFQKPAGGCCISSRSRLCSGSGMRSDSNNGRNREELKIINYTDMIEELDPGCGKCDYVCPVHGTAGINMTGKAEKTGVWE